MGITIVKNHREYNEPYYNYFLISDVGELANLPTSTTSPKTSIGSEAEIETTGVLYKLSNQNTWLVQKNGSELLGKVSIDQTTEHANEIVIKTVGSAITHTDILVGVISTVVLVANASRKYALLVNDSDTTVYIKIGSAASLNSGIRINPNGGSYEMSAIYGNLDTRVINAISSVAGKLLLVTEGE